jgi:phosphohistidine phosphatase
MNTMKTLVLMRHAKSSWKDRAIADHDRPLKKRGRLAAAVMGRWLLEQGLRPETILCSSARRARETLELMREAAPSLPEPAILAALYEAGPSSLLEQLRRLPEESRSALLLGHQPALGELMRLLTRHVRRREDRRAFERFPTAAIAILEADVAAWARLGPDTADLVRFAAPRDVETRAGSPS